MVFNVTSDEQDLQVVFDSQVLPLYPVGISLLDVFVDVSVLSPLIEPEIEDVAPSILVNTVTDGMGGISGKDGLVVCLETHLGHEIGGEDGIVVTVSP